MQQLPGTLHKRIWGPVELLWLSLQLLHKVPSNGTVWQFKLSGWPPKIRLATQDSC